jgi:hypothetical protein
MLDGAVRSPFLWKENEFTFFSCNFCYKHNTLVSLKLYSETIFFLSMVGSQLFFLITHACLFSAYGLTVSTGILI